jgi:nicotinate-nucleotide--dimethylbenzimidazole phosphoribosyltransferase
MEKIAETIRKIRKINHELVNEAQARLDRLTKPQGSLGRLEGLAKRVVGITGQARPRIQEKAIVTMAADHGVVAEGVSAYPQAVTPQMVYNFLRGGAAINVLARHVGARVVVVDMGVAQELEPHPQLVNKKIKYGTNNIARGPAMHREEAVRAIEAGIEVVEQEAQKGLSMVGTGDMGIGNTTASSAITAVFTGASAQQVTGRGTGIDDAVLRNKIHVVERALQINKPDPHDPINVLAKVGGLEIGGLVGVILAGAAHGIPVVIDGFISGAAALIACAIEPEVREYIIAAHCSAEPGHRIALQHMGCEPLLDLGMRLGEGTGAALGMSLVEAAMRILNDMATFKDAGVSEKTPR